MGEKLPIFLSSAINTRTTPFRGLIKRELEKTDLAEVWRFESEPAHPHLKEAFLPKVRNCDIFVVVLWDELTPIVRQEYDCAVDNEKSILMFLIKGEPQKGELDKFVTEVSSRVKWFHCSEEELPMAAVVSVQNLVVEKFRSNSVNRGTINQPLEIAANGPIELDETA